MGETGDGQQSDPVVMEGRVPSNPTTGRFAERDGARRASAPDGRAARTGGPATRTLLIIAAFGALGSLVLVCVAPATSLLAALFPPAYAVAAGVHSVLPLLGRRLLGFRWTATAVSGFVGVLSIGFTALGVLILVPLLVSGVAFDLTLILAGGGRPRERTFVLGAVVSALALFAVSLPVMSPEHLVPWILVCTLAGRLAGQLAAVALSAVIARRVLRAGIGRRLVRAGRPGERVAAGHPPADV